MPGWSNKKARSAESAFAVGAHISANPDARESSAAAPEPDGRKFCIAILIPVVLNTSPTSLSACPSSACCCDSIECLYFFKNFPCVTRFHVSLICECDPVDFFLDFFLPPTYDPHISRVSREKIFLPLPERFQKISQICTETTGIAPEFGPPRRRDSRNSSRDTARWCRGTGAHTPTHSRGAWRGPRSLPRTSWST